MPSLPPTPIPAAASLPPDPVVLKPALKREGGALGATEGAQRHVGHPALRQHAQAGQQVVAVGGVGLQERDRLEVRSGAGAILLHLPF